MVDCDADVDRPPGGLGNRGVDERQVAGLDPLLGEFARNQQLQGAGGVVAGPDRREPGLVDGGRELRADDRGGLAPNVRRGWSVGGYGRVLGARE